MEPPTLLHILHGTKSQLDFDPLFIGIYQMVPEMETIEKLSRYGGMVHRGSSGSEVFVVPVLVQESENRNAHA